MRKLAIALGTALLISTGPALAIPLSVGDNPLSGTTAAARPELAGVVLEDRLVPYSLTVGNDLLAGTVQQRVVREDVAGTLDFYWRILPDDAGNLPISSFRIGDFGDFITDGDWRIDGLGAVAPTSALVFATTGFVNFQFANPPVGPATDASSRFFFLHTSAVRYADTAQYDLVCAPSGCITDQYSTFAPSTAIPEPGAWAMMLLGFLGLGALMRRARREGDFAAA